MTTPDPMACPWNKTPEIPGGALEWCIAHPHSWFRTDPNDCDLIVEGQIGTEWITERARAELAALRADLEKWRELAREAEANLSWMRAEAIGGPSKEWNVADWLARFDALASSQPDAAARGGTT